jgi:hypothetical protein
MHQVKPHSNPVRHLLHGEYPLFEMFGTRSVLDLRFLGILGYFCIHNELSWGWDAIIYMG